VHVSASFVHVYIWFASFSGSSFLFIKFLTFEQKKKNHKKKKKRIMFGTLKGEAQLVKP
jgi:hypothetical protein